jgi:hypothetical protein
LNARPKPATTAIKARVIALVEDILSVNEVHEKIKCPLGHSEPVRGNPVRVSLREINVCVVARIEFIRGRTESHLVLEFIEPFFCHLAVTDMTVIDVRERYEYGHSIRVIGDRLRRAHVTVKLILSLREEPGMQ